MAEAIAIVGTVAAIAQLVDLGLKVSKGLEELSSNIGNEQPKWLNSTSTRLRLVLEGLKKTRQQAKLNEMDEDARTMLNLFIQNTLTTVQQLLQSLESLSTIAQKKGLRRNFTILRSLPQFRKVQAQCDHLQTELDTLMFFQTSTLVELNNDILTQLKKPPPSSHPKTDHSLCNLHRETPELASLSNHTDQTIPGNHNDRVRVREDSPVPLNQTLVTKYDRQPKGGCAKSCSCVCHRVTLLQTPAFLGQVFGNLAVATNGNILGTVQCSEKQCKRQSRYETRMNYRCPSWLLDRAVHIVISSTALSSKSCLQTMRVLPDSAEVFSVVSKGDLSRLRIMFKEGQASIYDVNRSNWSLLNCAFTLGQLEICNFLLNEGIDPGISADNGSNAIERAWIQVQSKSTIPGQYVTSENLVLRRIDLEDYLQSHQYTTIHKIVLGISRLSLTDYLETSTAEINEQDIGGFTALWWASIQGNTAAVKTLLEYGADPAVTGRTGLTPLHKARNPEVLRLLLQHGAKVDARDALGRMPLHCFCYHQTGALLSLVQAIIEAGAPVNAQARSGQSPLHYAASFDNKHLVPILLRYGADINATNAKGVTPLMAAVRYCQNNMVSILMQCGADLSICNKDKQSILHIAAIYADSATLHVLSLGRLGALECDAEDDPGHTASWYFGQRKLTFPELDATFASVLENIRSSTEQRVEVSDPEISSTEAVSVNGIGPKQVTMPGSYHDDWIRC